MEIKHWIFLAIIFVIGYVVGVKFPATGNKIVGITPSVSM